MYPIRIRTISGFLLDNKKSEFINDFDYTQPEYESLVVDAHSFKWAREMKYGETVFCEAVFGDVICKIPMNLLDFHRKFLQFCDLTLMCDLETGTLTKN